MIAATVSATKSVFLLPGLFVSGILASNYLLASVPQFKLMDLLVFLAGYTLGWKRGVGVAAAAWLYYGSFNPWGWATIDLLAVLIVFESLFALSGSLVKRFNLPGWSFVVTALVVTLVYDFGTSLHGWIVYSFFPFGPASLWFFAKHTATNIVLFSGASLFRRYHENRS